MKSNKSYSYEAGERHAHGWGYTDTRFEIVDERSVRVTGDRYPICGYTMPYLIPFAEKIFGLSFRPQDVLTEKKPEKLPDSRINTDFEDALKETITDEQIKVSDLERLRHSHGQLSVNEVYRVLYGAALERYVDMVIYPQSEDDVHRLSLIHI